MNVKFIQIKKYFFYKECILYLNALYKRIKTFNPTILKQTIVPHIPCLTAP